MGSYPESKYRLAIAAEEHCYRYVIPQLPPNNSDLYCPPMWDGWGCWNYTLAGHLAFVDCPLFVEGFDISRQAHRYCTETGDWWRAPNNKTWANYTTCIDIAEVERGKRLMKVSISGYAISTLFLATALFIFFYFKQLHCPRVSLHKNLFTSYILNSIAWILYYTLPDEDVLALNPLWCRVLHVLTQYFVSCNFFWMFCEGLYLHTLIVVAFTTGKKLLLACCLIGWCLPVIPTVIYTAARAVNRTAATRCWFDPNGLTWIIFGPIIATIIINVLFICNIIRVLVTKIRAVNSPSSTQHRKAVRAALILIPLLGIQFILFPLEPPPGTIGRHVFQMASAIVVSYQGFFVALIFCFFNGEVISVIRRRWGQHRLMRSASVISATSKHRDSMFYNQTQVTVIDPPPGRDSSSLNGCHTSGNSRGRSLKNKWSFFNRFRNSESSNGLVQHTPMDICEEKHNDYDCENDSNEKGEIDSQQPRVTKVTFGEDSKV